MSATATITKKFRLLRGVHVGPSSEDPALNKVFEPGDVIESNFNLEHLNDPRCTNDDKSWNKKYELLPEQGDIIPTGAIIFDPSKETLEQFAERMKKDMVVAPVTISEERKGKFSSKN